MYLCSNFVDSLSPNGATALGPAAQLAIAMASRQPGSKVSLAIRSTPNFKPVQRSCVFHATCTFLTGESEAEKQTGNIFTININTECLAL